MKYKKMLDIAEYRQQMFEEQGSIVYENYDENTEKEIDNLRVQKGIFEKELRNIRKSYEENQSFKKYIEKMKLTVVTNDGAEIPVNSKTIKNYNDINELLKARLRIVTAEIASIDRRIQNLDRVIEDTQISFVTTNSILQEFDKKISAFDIDYKTVQKIITTLEKSPNIVHNQKLNITNQTKQQNRRKQK